MKSREEEKLKLRPASTSIRRTLGRRRYAFGAFSEVRHVMDVEEGEEESVTGGDNRDVANAADGAINTRD